MISGRYRSEDLCKHWSGSNKLGFCLANTCSEVIGDLNHILIVCPALQDVRDRFTKLWLERSSQSPALYQLIRMVLASPPSVQVQFILDPTCFNGMGMLVEIYGQPILDHVLYLTRTYAYYMHREKLKMLGRWPGDYGRRPVTSTKSQPISHTYANNPTINNTNTLFFPGSVVSSHADLASTTLDQNYLTSPECATGYPNSKAWTCG